jgi:hypothetical protein
MFNRLWVPSLHHHLLSNATQRSSHVRRKHTVCLRSRESGQPEQGLWQHLRPSGSRADQRSLGDGAIPRHQNRSPEEYFRNDIKDVGAQSKSTMEFSFLQSVQECLTIDVIGPDFSNDSDEDLWLEVQIRASAGCFRGSISTVMPASDFVNLAPQLRILQSTLDNEAIFSAKDEQLYLRLTGTKKGEIFLEGSVADQAGHGNRLSFTLQFGLTQLNTSIGQLDAIIASFKES